MEPAGIVFFLLLIVVILTITLVLPAFWGGMNTDQRIGSVFGFLILCVIEFGMIGTIGTATSHTTYVENFQYEKFENGVSVSFTNPVTDKTEILNFQDTRTYNTINDSSYIRMNYNRNIYGFYTTDDFKVVNTKPKDSE